MKRICVLIGVVIGAVAGLVAPAPPHVALEYLDAPPAEAHDATHLDSMPTMLPGELAHIAFGANTSTHAFPEYATNCNHFIRSTRTSAIGNCYNYSGSGSLKYQVAALGVDACGRRMWFYGSVGQVYYPGKTTRGYPSLVYSPGGTWRFYYATVIVWKP